MSNTLSAQSPPTHRHHILFPPLPVYFATLLCTNPCVAPPTHTRTHSYTRSYPGALHCFRKAVLLNPSHVRAHYSMGQVHSLTGRWGLRCRNWGGVYP